MTAFASFQQRDDAEYREAKGRAYWDDQVRRVAFADLPDWERELISPLGRPRIIGLSGFPRSGKDTAANLLIEEGYTRCSIFDPVRAMLLEQNPTVEWYRQAVSLRQLVDHYGWEQAKDIVPALRPLMQRTGSAVIALAGAQVLDERALAGASVPTVFPDLRRRSTANAIQWSGGQVWRLEREGFGPGTDHEAENEMTGYVFDRVVVNDGTREGLRAALLEALDG